jgi:hypothetical protein
LKASRILKGDSEIIGKGQMKDKFDFLVLIYRKVERES